MANESFKRKLTAILSADVEGYSRLMGEDEDATIRTLTSYRELMSTLIHKHRGRVVDSPGDNLLAEFTSVVDAVRCAVEIQEELRVRNAELPENRRMQFRIGINLGDVVEEEERIYGDGVNITARVEGLAEGGGICISGTVYDSIKSKLSLSYESLGEHTVKNITEPVRVYRMRIGPEAAAPVAREEKAGPRRWQRAALAAVVVLVVAAGAWAIWNFYLRPAPPSVEPAAVEKMAFALPDKPSIAVLPFANLSDEPKQEFFADGMTDDLITDLSKISGLFVIARNSTFTYKGKPVKIRQVAEELGVRYVLEGSVRRADNQVRINAQLIDATTGGHLWAERYDRSLKDIFALQDEVIQKIVAALALKLTEDEHGRLVQKYTDNLQAYDSFLKGIEHLYRSTKETNLQAQQMFERAVDLDSEFAAAYAMQGRTHLKAWSMGWSQDPHQSLDKAFQLAKKVIALDDSLPTGHALLGGIYLWKKQHELAIAEMKKAIALDPNDADVLAELGEILSWSGRPEESIGVVKKAMRLNPMYPVWYLWALGHAYYMTGQHEQAIETFKRVLNRNPSFLPAHAYLTAIYSEQGRQEEAQAEAIELVRLSPQTSTGDWRERLPYKDQAVLERLFVNIGRTLSKEVTKRRSYVHTGEPVFKFDYPEGSKKVAITTSNQVLSMKTPIMGVSFSASITDILEGMTLADVGPKIYLPWLNEVGSHFTVASNEAIILKDGTQAYRTEIKWLWKDKTWITTLLVSAFKDDKWVYLSVHPWKDPSEFAWIVESLTFE